MEIVKYIIEFYLLFILVSLIVFTSALTKRGIYLSLLALIFGLISCIAYNYQMYFVFSLYSFATIFCIIINIVSQDKNLSGYLLFKKDIGRLIQMPSEDNKNQIIDACLYLSKNKIGALITIERHNSLDQFSNKAIQINSDISRDLLINIFTPNTPLHDGGVIIRGNKIRCAGAYYVLTNKDDIEKTTGSRHRAAIGISQETDSLTIVCSEETGQISVALDGFMIHNLSKEKLDDYLNMFMIKG